MSGNSVRLRRLKKESVYPKKKGDSKFDSEKMRRLQRAFFFGNRMNFLKRGLRSPKLQIVRSGLHGGCGPITTRHAARAGQTYRSALSAFLLIYDFVIGTTVCV